MSNDIQENNKLIAELPTTSELYEKHFGKAFGVGLFHPNMEAFFEDLNNVCKMEDSIKKLTPQ